MKIDRFDADHRWLSNFWLVDVHMYGLVYPSVEHAYQAAKTLDLAAREEIRRANTPGIAKRMGQRVTLREDWADYRLMAMRGLLLRKFDPIQHTALAEKLLATGQNTLIEGNYWGDTFWGVCRGVGENHLGRLLMEVRTLLEPVGAGRA